MARHKINRQKVVAFLEKNAKLETKEQYYLLKIFFESMYVMDVNWTYCDDHFSVFSSIESLCCMPETNIIYQLYLNLKT